MGRVSASWDRKAAKASTERNYEIGDSPVRRRAFKSMIARSDEERCNLHVIFAAMKNSFLR